MVSRNNHALHQRLVGKRSSASPLGSVEVAPTYSRPVTTLIDAYDKAKSESRALKQPVRFIVSVGQRGNLSVAPLEGRGRRETATIVPEPVEPDTELATALAAARQRGQVRVAEILSGDDMLSADQFATLLGTSRVTVNTKRQNNQVLGLEGAKRGFRFPDWQIGDDGKPFAALPALFDRLGGSAWAVYRFLVQHHPELDGLSGRDALRRGRAAEVLDAAESILRAPA